ncbi:Fic family protein [uncultured Thiodictyon sp.]|uniref:Fic family protein n=2 Tax=uncultured Thiodictyon sp. TaxID=1846217 RepID=UPI0025EA72DB|nr:Fic family protein [uncultured Thiodictyon sp.]
MMDSDRISVLKRRLDALRPLSRGALESLEAWYEVELTYTSNAIEGNTLTRQETALVLGQGITVRGKPLKDHLEAIDHQDAWRFVRELAQRGVPIVEYDIRQIHALVLGRSDREEAGRYSQRQRMILGSLAVLPSPAEVPALMGDFTRWLAAAPPDPATAGEAHYRLVAIHPFTDGNGRTARLLMNLILLQAGFPPVVITPEQRPDYVDALETRHVSGDAGPWQAFMTERLIEGLERYLEILEKEQGPAETGA